MLNLSLIHLVAGGCATILTKSPQRVAAGVPKAFLRLCSVIADGFDRAAFFGFLAASFLLRGGWLLKYIRVTAVLVPLEIIRCGFAAQVAVYALVINVVFARDVLRIFISSISHKMMYVCAAIWREAPIKASLFEVLFGAAQRRLANG
jgi:hypothetical protein